MAGIGPEDIDVAQLQDTESGAEIMHMAENGFCEHGEQEAMLARGDTEIGGKLPVNTDGGCLANGEPVGASRCANRLTIGKTTTIGINGQLAADLRVSTR